MDGLYIGDFIFYGFALIVIILIVLGITLGINWLRRH